MEQSRPTAGRQPPPPTRSPTVKLDAQLWQLGGSAARRVGPRPAGASALPTNRNPNPQGNSRERIRLLDAYSLTTFIRLQTPVGPLC